MWSYASVYRDQGQNKGRSGSDGKEVCDLLVVFQNHIIIFSDKDCRFPNTGNLEVDWSRWYRKAVLKSAEQIWGAERWILSHPDRLFLDRSCQQRFPVNMPSTDQAIIHRIVVAHGASEQCIKEVGGAGSLMIVPAIQGLMHYDSSDNNIVPFAIGHCDPDKGFIHVFDDHTLHVVMQTLDTISDFVNYLIKKETLINSGKLISAAGEDNLLAYYLRNVNEKGEHDFVLPPQIDAISIEEGEWSRFEKSPQRKKQIEADKLSYVWDKLIEMFLHHFYQGTTYRLSHPNFHDQEKKFKLLARESRFKRRILAKALIDLLTKTPLNQRVTRTIPPVNTGDPLYLFLLLPRQNVPYEQYREVRGLLLEAYCKISKHQYPYVQDIIGIATETGNNNHKDRTEDIIYLDTRLWSQEQEEDAIKLLREFEEIGMRGPYTFYKSDEKEYPEEIMKSSKPINNIYMKGHNRNSLCPCGSGKKIKKCCG